MSILKKKIKQLGSKFKHSKEPDQREIVNNFISDLKVITTSIGDLVENLDEQFEDQVIKERSLIQKTLLKLPAFLQPVKLKEEEADKKNLTVVKQRIITLNTSLEHIEEGLTSVPLTHEEMGKRIYEVAYPGQEINEENITVIEERFQEIEKSFFESLQQVNTQMSLITDTLTNISDKLGDQGIVLEGIDIKLDRVETKVDQARITLEKISAKLSQNRALLAFLLGAVVILLGALILL